MAGTKTQLKDIFLKPYKSTGTGVGYAISVERLTEYVDGETFFVEFHIASGDAATLNVNGLGAKNILVNGINVVTSQLVAGLGYFVKYDLALDKFVIVGGGSGAMSCSDVKDCIENFTDLDLSWLDELILGGQDTDIYINGSTLHYDGVTEEWTGDNIINLGEGSSITNNLDGEVNNNYGATYEENNVFEEGSVVNNEGEVTNNNTNYTENNVGGIYNFDNSEVNFGDETVVNLTNLNIQGGNLVVNVTTDKDDQIYNGTDLTRVLPSMPLTEDALHITTDSGTNLILGVDYSIVGDTITWIINPNTSEHVYARWLRGQANTVPGGVAYYEEYTAILNQTTFPLVGVPAGKNFIRVSQESALYAKQGPTRDFTYDTATNSLIFNTPMVGGEVISIQFIGFIAMPVQPTKKVDGVAWTGPSTQLVINDADVTATSVVMGWTITSGTVTGFWQRTVGAGTLTIDSTGSEENLVLSYVIYK